MSFIENLDLSYRLTLDLFFFFIIIIFWGGEDFWGALGFNWSPSQSADFNLPMDALEL